MQTFHILLLVLDDTGRYSMTGVAGSTMVQDYPPGRTCEDFGSPPRADRYAEGGPYDADVLAAW